MASEEASVLSPLEQRVGTRLSVGKLDIEKQERMLKKFLFLTRDVDVWVEENRCQDRSPHVKRILEEHRILKERILALFQEAMLWSIEFRVWNQIRGLVSRINIVKRAAGIRLRLGARSMSNHDEDNVFIDEPRRDGEPGPGETGEAGYGQGEPISGNQLVLQPVITAEDNKPSAPEKPQVESIYMRGGAGI